jgi:hypothetical protein
MATIAPTPQLVHRQEVVVTDIRMPFGSMLMFMVKWAIASIPAMVILVVLGAFLWAVTLAVFSSFTGSKNNSSVSSIDGSQIPAHEASAVAGIKAVNEAEMIRASSHPNSGFTSSLEALGREELIDNNLARGEKGGYSLVYTAGEKVNGAIRSYSLTAVPDQVGATGERRFYSDESGEIHYSSSGPADDKSPVLR